MAAVATMTRNRPMTDWPHDLWALRLSDAAATGGADTFHRSWIMLFREGVFQDRRYGKVDLTRKILDEVKANFDAGVRGIEIALDEEHDGAKATGWIESLEYRPAVADESAGLWALVRWTSHGLHLLKEQIYRYISPEFNREWTNPVDGKTYCNVLVGGALTNRPVLQMKPVQLSERGGGKVSTRAWGSVDKSCLPDSAFLDSKNRRLPIYEGTGPKDAQGRYTQRGKLNIHGARDALAAIHGACSGKAMTGLPSGTAERLQRLLDRYGGSGDDGEGKGGESVARKASEGQGKAKMKRGKPATDDAAEDQADSGADEQDEELDEEEYAEGEMPEDEMYDDADGDEDGDEEEEAKPAPKKGKATRKAVGSSAKMSETYSGEAVALREQLRERDRQLVALREREAALSLKLYEREVDEQIATWGGESFAPSKSFSDAYRGFMLSEGLRLSEDQRGKLTELVELAFKGAVELSQNGHAFDLESRVTKSSNGDKVAETANRLALSDPRNKAQKDMGMLAAGSAEERAIARELLLRAFKETGADFKKLQLVAE